MSANAGTDCAIAPRQVHPDLEEFHWVRPVGLEQREHLGVVDALAWPGGGGGGRSVGLLKHTLDGHGLTTKTGCSRRTGAPVDTFSPAVIHCTSPSPNRPEQPSESVWSQWPCTARWASGWVSVGVPVCVLVRGALCVACACACVCGVMFSCGVVVAVARKTQSRIIKIALAYGDSRVFPPSGRS